MNNFFEIVSFTNKNRHPIFFLRTGMGVTLLEAPTAFLHDCYVQNKKRAPSVHTWAAASQAIKSWLEFLPAIPKFEGQGIDPELWRKASRVNRAFYRDCYLSYMNESTGRTYSEATIASRMVVIIRFYEWASLMGMYDGDMLSALSYAEAGNAPIDRDMLAHTHGGHRRTREDDNDLPKVPISASKVNPLEPHSLDALLHMLGPRPTEGRTDGRPVRNRVFADLIIDTGIRVSEALNLTIHQFLQFTIDPTKEDGGQNLSIYRGKGNKNRVITIHNWIITDVLAYINGEREEALKAGKIASRAASKQLFLNRATHHRAGKPTSVGAMQKMFSESCIKAGLIAKVPQINPGTGEATFHVKAAYSIHDLRHTYAVRYCEAAWICGITEPWLLVKTQLGHSSVETTKQCYLRFLDLSNSKHVTFHQSQQRAMGA